MLRASAGFEYRQVAVFTRAAYVPPSPRPLPEGTSETAAARVRHALGMADYGQHGFHHPDFDTEPTLRVSPGIRGRVRVVPDSPGHLLRCTVGASGRFLDTDLKEVR